MFVKMTISKIVPYLILVCLLASGMGACKSKKKVAAMTASQSIKDTQPTAAELEEIDRKEREAREKIAREEEERRKNAAPLPTEQRLTNYFQAIGNAPSVAAANNSIAEALSMFATPNTPVLIVIYDDGIDIDYDEPTTIEKYLNYLKDQKKQPDALREVKTNSAGKITEVELRKN